MTEVPSSVIRHPTSVGGVAQSGERLLCKQEVVGSIPITSTKRSWEHEIAAAVAAVVFEIAAAVAAVVFEIAAAVAAAGFFDKVKRECDRADGLGRGCAEDPSSALRPPASALR